MLFCIIMKKDIVEYYLQYLAVYKRFIDEVLLSGAVLRILFWNFWVPLTMRQNKLNLLIA